MQARRSSLYRKVEEGGVVLPDPFCFFEFDDNTLTNAEYLVDTMGNAAAKVGIEDSLADVWVTSPIGSYCLRCASADTGARARWYSDAGVSDFYIDGGNPDKPFTMTTWLYPSVATFRLSTIYNENLTKEGQYYTGTDQSNYPHLVVVDGKSTVNSIRATGNTALTLNQWVHYAATYDGSGTDIGIKIYIDGVEQAVTRSSSGNFVRTRATTARLRTMHLYSSSITYTAGRIDNWRFYKQELTPEQIMADYLLVPDPKG